MLTQLMLSATICTLFAITFANSARSADDLSGTYWLEDSDGSFVLTLEDHGETVRGTMTGDGMTMRVEAYRQGKVLEGHAAAGDQLDLGFYAEIDGDRLLVQLREPGESGSAASPALTFLKQGSTSGGSNAAAASGSGSDSTPGEVSAKAASGEEVKIADWNIRYRRPSGWNVAREFGHVALLGSDTEAGGVFVSPGIFRSAEDAVSELSAMLSALNLTGKPVEAPSAVRVGDREAIRAIYEMTDGAGQTTRGRFYTIFSGKASGLLILGMTTADHYTEMEQRVDGMAASAVVRDPNFKPERAAMLVGTWTFSNTTFSPDIANSGSSGAGYEETLVFSANGTFTASSSSYVSGSSGTLYGGETSASNTNQDGDSGVYTVLGDRLVLRSAKSGTQILTFSQSSGQLEVNGRTYVR